MIPISAVGLVTPLQHAVQTAEPSRQLVEQVEAAIRLLPDTMRTFPVNEQLEGGIYVRAFTLPKGGLAAGRCHKYDHWVVVLGDIETLTENGLERIKGPTTFFVKAGAKRIVYGNEDSVYITYHRTDAESIDNLIEELAFETYDEFDDWKAAQERILLPVREVMYA